DPGRRAQPLITLGDAAALANSAFQGAVYDCRESPLWVKNGSPAWASECPLLGVQRTSILGG
ncbi:MAG: hypothetical protein O7B24_01650, partial [Alphaproteobacteria bacterium]|nr:hypothetical protein [Alphaproteobacteria bacterium]